MSHNKQLLRLPLRHRDRLFTTPKAILSQFSPHNGMSNIAPSDAESTPRNGTTRSPPRYDWRGNSVSFLEGVDKNCPFPGLKRHLFPVNSRIRKMSNKIWLRAETKPAEARSALTPTTCKQLIDAGYEVTVERSTQRIFDDEEFPAVGATLVEEGSWVKDAPKDAYVLGLKELPEEDFPLEHVHISFAHCYKQQGGWEKVLSRWPRGGGTLLDLEFLTDDAGRRVAAFGYSAGYAGSALAVKNWAWQLSHPNGGALPGEVPYANQDLLIESVKETLEAGKKSAGRSPKVLVIGALGRCGSGAVDLAKHVGIPESDIFQWDIAETKKGGPFKEIVEDADIFINCIYLSAKIPPFVNAETLSSPTRRLSVICDVSADTTNPHNPVPVYEITTTFDKPTVPVKLPAGTQGPPLSVISIDHLPSLLPRESSEMFSEALMPSLLQLKERGNARVWKQAEELFKEKVATLPESLRA